MFPSSLNMRNRPVSKESIEVTVGRWVDGTGAALDRATSASIESTTDTRVEFILVRVARVLRAWKLG